MRRLRQMSPGPRAPPPSARIAARLLPGLPSRLGRALGRPCARRVRGDCWAGRIRPAPAPPPAPEPPGTQEEEGGSARTARGAALLQAPVPVSGVGPGTRTGPEGRISTPTPAQPW